MKTIWKWTLAPKITVDMPKDAQILAIQAQNDEPQMWALVDPQAEMCKRTFNVYGTGTNVPDNPGVYRGTFQLSGGALVFHVFETI
jgi:hypothetical protein